ncbi:MAG: tRNA-cytidine(32) 2-sulfurtransferase [Chlamydiales bacterium]|nr:tRNA-cytidine(32) 2-sulfurtransferase [Chlamydiales bacterium]MCH9620311.1 tRNA-cytidine(32) 2-sulfurtransferase [Chlamydiales bacterium]MCH9622778.1 tRNA-cytidine(32) 2-sulfurtransferase [Chlamydiales bacterium]
MSKKIESAIRKALYEFEMVEEGSKIAVALSGGKDSLTLLFMLKAILGRGCPAAELVAIHVDGEFSCGAGVQKNYLQKICDDLEVPLLFESSTMTLETLKCYRCSRERRRLIFEAAKRAGAYTIAFGHHRDDSAQTLLLNLLHKGEFAANLPKLEMVDYGVTLIRPLIYLSENEIVEYAKKHGFARVMCQCPVGQKSMRKKVDTLLSEIESLFPHARANVARAGLLYGSDKAKRDPS